MYCKVEKSLHIFLDLTWKWIKTKKNFKSKSRGNKTKPSKTI